MKFATVLVENCEVGGLLGTIYETSISACGLLGIVFTVHSSSQSAHAKVQKFPLIIFFAPCPCKKLKIFDASIASPKTLQVKNVQNWHFVSKVKSFMPGASKKFCLLCKKTSLFAPEEVKNR